MGCLKRFGCLALLVVLLIVGFFTRGLWVPKLRGTKAEPVAAGSSGWQPLTREAGQRGARLMQQLAMEGGPANVTLAPAELAAYVLQEMSATLPESADSIQAAAMGDRLCVRAVVKTADIADKNTLGPLSMLLGAREPVRMCGVIKIHAPGRGELQVKEFQIREFKVPGPAIPRIIKQMSPTDRPADLAADGLPLRTPMYVGDVRVANGQITISRQARTQ